MWTPEPNEFCDWVQEPVSWLDVVTSVEGFGAHDDPAGRMQAFIDLIAPKESHVVAGGMITMSTCALTVRGLWRCWGLTDELLWQPYKNGHAVSDVVKIASDHAAWKPANTFPEAGDVVLIGGDGSGNEHVFTCVDISGDTVTSIDGGQVDKHGKQCVLRCERKLSWKSKNLFVGARHVVGVCKMTQVLAPDISIRAIKRSA